MTANIGKWRTVTMDSSNPGPLLGRFKAENAENILKAYRIVMDVKETYFPSVFEV